MKRQRPCKLNRPALSTIWWGLLPVFAISLGLLPVRTAFADQVLEVPQAASSSPISPGKSDPPSDEVVPPRSKPRHEAPLPENLGTLQDYVRETQGDSSTGASSNFAPASSISANPVIEIDGNGRQSLAQNAILGLLMIGLFAMEANAAHHHHH